MNKKNNRKGFTTVELVIVIAVIAILATVLIPTFSNLIENANDSASLQEANSVYKNWLNKIENAQNFTKDTVLAIETESGTYVFEDNKLTQKPVDATKLATLNCNNCIFLRLPKAGETTTDGYMDITSEKHEDNKGKEENGAQVGDGKCDICGKDIPSKNG